MPNDLVKNKPQESVWKRLTRLFRSGPIVRHKIASGEVHHEPQGTARAFKKELSSLYVHSLASFGQYERLSKYADFQEMEYMPEIHCLSIDSIIYTPSGEFTIKELLASQEANPNGWSFQVYAYDESSGGLTIGRAHSIRKTKRDKIYRVELDSGKFIKCTGDHLFLTRDGAWIEAKNLTSGMSLMPFYRSNGKQKKGYNSVYTINKGWQLEHRFVAENGILNRPLKPYPQEVVHHIDLNKCNNSPDNLLVCSAKEHNDIHGREWLGYTDRTREIARKISAANKGKSRPSPFKGMERHTFESKRKISDSIKKLMSNPEERDRRIKGMVEWTQSGEGRAVMAAIATARNVDRWKYDSAYRQKMSRIFSEHAKRMHADPDFTQHMVKRRLETVSQYDEQKRKDIWGKSGRENNNFARDIDTQQILLFAMEYESLAQFVADFDDRGRFKSEKSKRQFILRRFQQAGFKGWKDYKQNYAPNNHKVVSVTECGEEDVYDLTVDKYHNFVCEGVVVHNSALDIVADEVTAQDEHKSVIKIVSKNGLLKKQLETLFFDIINIEFNLWAWVRNLVKYGDFILFVDASEENGILNLLPIPINEIEREEGYDKNDPFAVRFRWLTQGNKVLENWQIIHFRLIGNDGNLPYGSSFLESARRIWRQLILIEDAMMVYRIVRSPERRVFYIDVGNADPAQIDQFMEQVKNRLRRNQIVDPNSGRVDLRYNPLSVDEDIFIPMRDNRSSRVETLAGGQFTGDIEDVEYIQKKLFAALKVPKAYLSYEAELGSKATLAQQDVRFSRTIERIQRIVIAELNKIAIIHLFLLGYRGADLVDFEIQMATSSTIAEQQKLELWRLKLEILATAQEGILDTQTAYEDILGFSKEKIDRIRQGKRFDRMEELALEAMQLPQELGAPVPGEEELPTDLGANVPPADGSGAPEETSPDEQQVAPEGVQHEKRNPGSEGDQAELAVDKGKDLFAPGENSYNHVFGRKKQTATDPGDMRSMRRLVRRPFSEDKNRDGFDEKLNEAINSLDNIDFEVRKAIGQLNRIGLYQEGRGRRRRS
jgi:hypothetical protein